MRNVVIVVGSIVIVALLVLLGFVIATRVIDTRPPPEATVQVYLDAISSGDATTANRLFDPAAIGPEYLFSPFTDATSFMSDAALGAASERITNVTITDVSRATLSDGSVVYFEYDLAGERHSEGVTLKWSGSEWRITTGLWHVFSVGASFSGRPDPDEKQLTVRLGNAIGDEEVALRDGDFLAYPGVYPIEIVAEGWYADPSFETVSEITLVDSSSIKLIQARFTRPETE